MALTPFAVLFVTAGCLAASFAVYLLVLAVAAFFYTERPVPVPPGARLTVLVPAHDESESIGRCVASLRAQTYAEDRYEIVVVADNCSDDTAARAAEAGADRVLTRVDPDARGKGRALRWALDRLLGGESAAAVVIVDADSVAAPRLLELLAARFEAGAQAVQGECLLDGDGTMRSELRAAAFCLVNRVRPAGRAVLGLSAHLAGNGMLLSRDVLVARPWEAFTSTEDLEYGIALRRDGVHIAFAGGAAVRSPTAPTARAAAAQQLRWEGGHAYVARTALPGLIGAALRERRPALLEVAFDLALPPLGLLAAIVIAGSGLGACLAATGASPVWPLDPWLVAAAAIPSYVVIGLRAGRAPRAAYRALLWAPLLIAAKPLRLRRVLRFRADSWVRTERPAESRVGGEP